VTREVIIGLRSVG